ASKHRVVVASQLFGARVADCHGQDIRDAARQEQARWALEPLRPTAAQEARWALGEDVRWGELPTLQGYGPSQAPPRPASSRQLKLLGSFGFEPSRDLNLAEASSLIGCCFALEMRFPTPATEGQEYLLRGAGRWSEGMSKREAQREIARLKAGTPRSQA